MLKLEKVNLCYVKDYCALCDISYEFFENTIYNLVGESASGKSSLLRCIAKLEASYTGLITYNGVDINSYDYSKELGVGYMPEIAVLLDEKSVIENLKYVVKLRQIVPLEEEDYYISQVLDAFKLSQVKNKIAKKLSYFEKQKLALARLSMRKLDILLVDNIFTEFDKQEIEEMFTYFKEYFFNQNMLIIISSHKGLKDYYPEIKEVPINAGIISSK